MSKMLEIAKVVERAATGHQRTTWSMSKLTFGERKGTEGEPKRVREEASKRGERRDRSVGRWVGAGPEAGGIPRARVGGTT